MTKNFMASQNACGLSSPLLPEYERLVGVAESLGEHHHDYGYLDVGAVDTYHGLCGFLVVEEIGYDHLSHVLAHDAGYTEYEQWP